MNSRKVSPLKGMAIGLKRFADKRKGAMALQTIYFVRDVNKIIERKTKA